MIGLPALVQSTRARRILLARRLESEAQQGIGRLVGLLLVGVLIAAVVFAAAFAGGWVVVLRGAPELVRTFSSIGLLALSAALVLSSLGHAAQAFFSAKDLWFWDSAPAPAWARFCDRTVETGLAALPTAMALGSVALCGLVIGGGGGLWGAARALVSVVLVATVPLFIGIGLAHIGGALLPAGKLRRASILLLGVFIGAALVWFRRARVEKILTPEGANELLQSARSVKAVGPEALPSALGSRFVVDGDLGALAGMLAWSAALGLLAFTLHRGLSRRARDLAVDESPIGMLRGSLRERALKAAVAPIRPDMRPLVEKDLLAFVRDPAQWGQVVLLLGVGLLYLVNASALREGFAGMPEIGRAILPAMHTGLVTFIAAGLAARFAFPQLGLEGPAVWIVDGSPLAPRAVMTAKWLSALPVVAFYPSLLGIVGGFVLEMDVITWSATTLLCTSVSFGVAAFGVGRGALKPLYDATSLSELAMGPGAISTMIIATALAGVASLGALGAGVAAVGLERAHGPPIVLGALIVGAAALPSALAFALARQALAQGAIAFVRRREDEAERAFLLRDAQPIALEE